MKGSEYLAVDDPKEMLSILMPRDLARLLWDRLHAIESLEAASVMGCLATPTRAESRVLKARQEETKAMKAFVLRAIEQGMSDEIEPGI